MHVVLLLMQQIHTELKFITTRMEEETKEQQAETDWKAPITLYATQQHTNLHKSPELRLLRNGKVRAHSVIQFCAAGRDDTNGLRSASSRPYAYIPR